MPEKMVGLNRNVHVTVTGSWRRLLLGEPDFPMGMHVLHSHSEQQGPSGCLLKHGEHREVGRARDGLSELHTGERGKERTRSKEDAGSTLLGKWNGGKSAARYNTPAAPRRERRHESGPATGRQRAQTAAWLCLGKAPAASRSSS